MAKCDTTFDRHRLATIHYFYMWYIYYPYIMHTHLSVRFSLPRRSHTCVFFGLRTTVLLWYISVFFIKTKVGEYCTGYGFYPYGNTKSLRPYFFMHFSDFTFTYLWARSPNRLVTILTLL